MMSGRVPLQAGRPRVGENNNKLQKTDQVQGHHIWEIAGKEVDWMFEYTRCRSSNSNNSVIISAVNAIIYRGYPAKRVLSAMRKHGG